MSQANVEIVRRFYAAWNGPDAKTATLEFIGEGFEWVNPDYAVEPGTRRGVQGWLQVLDSLDVAFEEFEHQPGDCLDLGDDVLCFARFVVKAGRSEIAFERDESHLWSLRDGKIVCVRWFHDRDEALEAAGLKQ